MPSCRCTIKDPIMPKTKRLDAEKGLEYSKIKKNLRNPFLRLFVNQTQKNLVAEVESLEKTQENYAKHNDELFDDLSYKLSKLVAVLDSNGIITISRFDDFVQHKTEIDNFFINRNISYNWLNGKLIVNDPVNILQVANLITEMNVTWCEDPITKETDGCFVITHCNTTLADMQQVIAEKGLNIQPDRPKIKTTFSLPNAKPDDPMYEDIDEVFEPLNVGELKKLKSRSVTNEYQIKILAV